MSYQLPQEVKTEKLNNAPDDIKAIAEALIAKKMGIPEVAEGEVQNERDFLEKEIPRPPQPLDFNTNQLRGEVVSRRGQRYNFVMSLSDSIAWEQRSYGQTSSWSGSRVSPLVNHVHQAVKRYVADFERMTGEMFDYVRLEINGHGAHVRSTDDITELLSKAYLNDAHRYTQNTWHTNTAQAMNWNYT